ncbi:hypothetical protein EVAR_47169_1 [Eumeta japonica]|uniref:Uncharacterized protein n=1 Tax=Eumeta variegata TaxID=151549 RepID=A0A4C1WX31_EUMVA|nr:hypothetical protein EVAR_47169_1 [Eumeta japonica]
MAHSGSLCESSDKRLQLKRKRDSSDEEDLVDMPPAKIVAKTEDVENEVVVESSTCSSSDDDSTRYENFELQPTQSAYTDSEYAGESLLSPPSVSELSNVFSPLENVIRGDSTPHSSRSRPEIILGSKRKCPLPGLSWAESSVAWNRMTDTDAKFTVQRNPHMFDNHPSLQPRMRAILLDWLNEGFRAVAASSRSQRAFHETPISFARASVLLHTYTYSRTLCKLRWGRGVVHGYLCLFRAPDSTIL